MHTLVPIVAMLLPVLCLPVLLRGAPDPAGRPAHGLTIRTLDLMDGPKWTLADQGLGRPFLVRLVLSNRSDAPLQLWSPDSVEGAACLAVTLTSTADQSQVKLSPTPPPRSGIPTAATLDPRKTLRIDFDLLRLIGTHSPPPGQYTLQVTYANSVDNAGPVRDIWTGSLQSQPVTIEIVRPAAAP